VNFTWSLIIDLGIIAVALVAATYIRSRVRFFQTFLIPNALTAGFLLLPYYNYIAPMQGLTSDSLGELVYHLLNLTFIAMILRKAPTGHKKHDGTIFATSIGTLSQYALQATLGLGITALFIHLAMPDLNPGFGLLLPLGFALGPGQAFAIGQTWESFGFEGAGSLGLSFAAMGFLWACFGGVFLMNYGIRKGWIEPEHLEKLNSRGTRSGVYHNGSEHPVGARLTTDTEAIDSFTFHIAMIFIIYLASYLFLHGFSWLLALIGPAGVQLAESLWGINFIFSALIAMVFRAVFERTGVAKVLDNLTLTRISGLSVDLMVASAVGAISLVVVMSYWLPILVISVTGGVVAFITVPWISSRMFKDHRFHRTLMIYGASTGTMPTGLSLLRAMDPEFETPVASDYMFSSGISFVLLIPLILIMNFPTLSKFNNEPRLYWITVALSIAYLLFVLVSFLLLARSRAFKRKNHVWLHEEPIKS
jgi:glutamate:Na+ symporter, ESS family